MKRFGLGLCVVAGWLAGCQPTCLSTCQRFYQPDQCNAKPEALTVEDAVADCTNVCEDALAHPGPAPAPGDLRFTGTRNAPPTASPQITNDLEAAAWMDCVWSFPDRETCERDLGKQYCVQVF